MSEAQRQPATDLLSTLDQRMDDIINGLPEARSNLNKRKESKVVLLLDSSTNTNSTAHAIGNNRRDAKLERKAAQLLGYGI